MTDLPNFDLPDVDADFDVPDFDDDPPPPVVVSGSAHVLRPGDRVLIALTGDPVDWSTQHLDDLTSRLRDAFPEVEIAVVPSVRAVLVAPDPANR